MGSMPIIKRADHNWDHSIGHADVTPEQIKILVEKCSYAEDRAKKLTKFQAQQAISAHYERNGRPIVPVTGLVKSKFVRSKR
jgi:hypothetical protein